ncbi:SRPBCC family protein [Chlorobium sp. N1]|uniref:SRPBCC family protein n=1 Tax=Chlorobium sp. N1 TaxID=2491138 RepID=UPI00103FB296|nr:SRPBCC family protein [Chlorobium sp. N1]TCD47888.1 hypothetical protein E0L29_06315 [Chlorobium sp. N1]
MSFIVEIPIGREFSTSADPKQVFRLLADVPRSASHFPKVEQLTDLGGGAYRWEMEKIELAGHTLQQTVYASRYTADEAALAVRWTPLDGVGNALVEGSWHIEAEGSGSRVRLVSKGELTLDFPGLLQPLLQPLVSFEFGRLVDGYVENLQRSFGATS